MAGAAHKRAFEFVCIEAVCVDRDWRELSVVRAEDLECAEILGVADNDDVAWIEQNSSEEVDGLLRSGSDRHLMSNLVS